MQSSILILKKFGPLPKSENATAELLDKYQEVFEKISLPITNDEALVLAEIFGDDDCFDMAWTILHLIETAPNWPLENALQLMNKKWASVCRSRIQR